jgi:toxin ParE1/3/4
VSLRIVKHRKAKRDALRIFVHIGEQNFDAARRFLAALDAEFHRIADMPGMGAKREFASAGLEGIRSLPVQGFTNYLIFYRYDETFLKILRVIHGARDIEQALLE